ncbi:MAG: hypothetical protein HC831_08350 [Chloroflexia bacterium]|nr:hypothetical protein [Chloroflexia bacterium]
MKIATKYPNEDSFDSVFFDETVVEQANSLIKSLNKNSHYHVSIIDLGLISDKHVIERQIWWMKDLPLNRSIDLYIE